MGQMEYQTTYNTLNMCPYIQYDIQGQKIWQTKQAPNYIFNNCPKRDTALFKHDHTYL